MAPPIEGSRQPVPRSLLLPKHGGLQRDFRPTCSSTAPPPPSRAATSCLSFFLLPDLLSTAIPISSGQWQSSLTVCPSFLPGFGTIVMQFLDREKGGEDLQTLIIKWTNTKEKLQPLADDCHTHKTQNVSPGLFLSPLPVAPPFILL